ncbi:Uncharacterised protein [uncultured archaeon]|nr:Uncharacterised protein [uncultured archaeon]
MFEDLLNAKIHFGEPYLQRQLEAIRGTTHIKGISENVMLDVMREHNEGTAIASRLTCSYNDFAAKRYSHINTRTMGRFLGEVATRSDMIELFLERHFRDRYIVRKDVVTDVFVYKLKSSEKRRKGLSKRFEGDNKRVYSLLSILLETNNDLLAEKKYNRNTPSYKKAVIPKVVAGKLSVDTDTAVDALELVSGSNGVSPFVIKGEKPPYYYVNGKQNVVIKEFLQYWIM